MKPIESTQYLVHQEFIHEVMKVAATGVTVIPFIHDETQRGTNSRDLCIEFEVRVKKFNGQALPATRKPI